jgi:hypothetical protein
LAAIREDPKVRKLARARAGDLELAEDALQETYYAVARMENPERIIDLRAYYSRVLLRNIHRLRSQLGAILIDDFGVVADTCQRKPGGEPPPPPFAEAVHTNMMGDNWRERLAMKHVALANNVPGRSPDPDRYRNAIATVSKEMLYAILAGDFREADLNLALRAAYPEWFAGRSVGASNTHQRFTRARADIRDLLKTVISLDEVRP